MEKRKGNKKKEFCSVDIISKRKSGLGAPLVFSGKLSLVVFSATLTWGLLLLLVLDLDLDQHSHSAVLFHLRILGMSMVVFSAT